MLGAGGRGGAIRDPVGQGTELRVVGGPAAGLVFRLGTGRFVLGRQDSCAVTIPDPEMSREHAALDVSPDGTMSISDLGSSNGTSLEGSGVGSTPVPIHAGQVVQVGASYVAVHPVDPLDGALFDDGLCGYVFNRRYRIRRPPPAVEIEFPEAKPEEDKPSFPWLMMGAPLVVAVGMAAVLKQPEFLLLAVMSPVMTLGSTMNDRKGRKRRRLKAGGHFEAETAEAAPPGAGGRAGGAGAPAGRLARSCRARAGRHGAAGPAVGAPVDRRRPARRTGRAGTQPSVVQMANHPSPPPAWAVPVVVPLPAVGVLGIAGTQAVAQAGSPGGGPAGGRPAQS